MRVSRWNRASACSSIEPEIRLLLKGSRLSRTKHPCSSLPVFSSCAVAGANPQRPEAEAAGTILDEISRQWTGEADASGGVLAHGAPGFSRESICDEFQAPSMADGGPERRYFSGRYGSGGNRGDARPTAYRRSPSTRSFCERDQATVWHRVPRKLRLRREHERGGALSVRSQDLQAARSGK